MSIQRGADGPQIGTRLPRVEDVDALPVEVLVDFATQAATLHARAMARLVVIGAAKKVAEPADELLTAKEAAPLLDISEHWIRRHGEREGLAVRIGRRTVKYSRRKIVEYLRRRRA